MDYSKLSDFEINRNVGEILLKGRWACKPGTAGNDTNSWCYGSVDQFVTAYVELPDYCNNPADAWPIIQQNGISITYDGQDWMASHVSCHLLNYSNDIHQHPDKPLRAAMIVYLMMQESE